MEHSSCNRIHRTIEGNNSAKDGHRVTGKGSRKGLLYSGSYTDSTRVHMFHGHRSWLGKFCHKSQRGVGIVNIIVREFLALKLLRLD